MPISGGNGMTTILLIDDEKEFRKGLAQQLTVRYFFMSIGLVYRIGAVNKT